MPETKEAKKEKSLILVGHYHHQATCVCGTSTMVESYYEQLPPILCPSCGKENSTQSSLQTTPFIYAKTGRKCSKCGCRYHVKPVPEKPTCPTCAHSEIETTDGNETPPKLQEGQAKTPG